MDAHFAREDVSSSSSARPHYADDGQPLSLTKFPPPLPSWLRRQRVSHESFGQYRYRPNSCRWRQQNAVYSHHWRCYFYHSAAAPETSLWHQYTTEIEDTILFLTNWLARFRRCLPNFRRYRWFLFTNIFDDGFIRMHYAAALFYADEDTGQLDTSRGMDMIRCRCHYEYDNGPETDYDFARFSDGAKCHDHASFRCRGCRRSQLGHMLPLLSADTVCWRLRSAASAHGSANTALAYMRPRQAAETMMHAAQRSFRAQCKSTSLHGANSSFRLHGR